MMSTPGVEKININHVFKIAISISHTQHLAKQKKALFANKSTTTFAFSGLNFALNNIQKIGVCKYCVGSIIYWKDFMEENNG